MTKHKLLEDLKSHFETIGAIRNLAQECSQKLIDFLLKDSQYSNEYKSRFFLESAGMLVFKQQEFLTFLDLKNLSGSFTSYANKIGLSSKTRGLLKASNEVVLNFAYKDGFLKGGQSRDEQKQNEIFFHEILAKDEIDVLFEPKVLQNFEAIGDENLEKLITEESSILLKGNNLLALHSLKKKYRGKVKLIYIDPPYNTGDDSFKYNDKFNHSTWLTFMKNRLEIAREFLRDDGVIFVQCDDNEQAYLKVLMDEIFGREKFIGCFMWMKTSTPPSLSRYIRRKLEYILCFKKNELPGLNGGVTNGGDMPLLNSGNSIDTLIFPPNSVRFSTPDGTYHPEVKDKVELLEELLVKDGRNATPLKLKGEFKWKQDTLLDEIENGTDFIIKTKKFAIRYMRDGERIKRPSNLISKRECGVGTNEDAQKELFDLFGIKVFDYPKPESLSSYIIEMVTQQNDLVMDFFAGSGTTLAVAHKMGRKWIGIEQMGYIQDITKERLKKVIDGEQGGISEVVEWKGGGNFIYAELMPFNAIYRERIEISQDEKELEAIYKVLEEKAFLDYRVDLQEILADQDFANMSLEDKKETLRLILDENMDYVPLGDIEDKTYGIDEDTIRLNKMFYGEKQ